MTELSATVKIDPADDVFTGHYRGFPILPGVFLIEHVDATVRAARPELRPAALDRAKFLRPVFPGDEVTITATLTEHGAETRCGATVSTADGDVAEIRLGYRGGAS